MIGFSRVLLACALAASIAVSLTRTQREDSILDARLAIVRTLEQQGLTLQSPIEPGYGELAPLLFAAKDCNDQLLVMPATLSLQEHLLLESQVKPTFARRYIYLARTWPQAAPMAVRYEWLKHRILALIGMRPSVLPSWVVLASEPPGCKVIDRIDWSGVWRRQRAA